MTSYGRLSPNREINTAMKKCKIAVYQEAVIILFATSWHENSSFVNGRKGF